MLDFLSLFLFSFLVSDDGGGDGVSLPAAWTVVARGTAISAIAYIAVKNLIASLFIHVS
jgi:hypothetical protein